MAAEETLHHSSFVQGLFDVPSYAFLGVYLFATNFQVSLPNFKTPQNPQLNILGCIHLHFWFGSLLLYEKFLTVLEMVSTFQWRY